MRVRRCIITTHVQFLLPVVILCMGLGITPAAATFVPDGDAGLARAALQAAAQGNGFAALNRAHGLSDPLARDLVLWRAAREKDSGLSFSEITRFVHAHPTWPNQTLIRQRAEESLDDAARTSDVLNWFDAFPPLTTAGRLRYAAALKAVGRDSDRSALVRTTWRDDRTLSPKDESALLAAHGNLLGTDDHAARLDTLLWAGKTTQARPLLDRVPADTRAIGQARIGLQTRTMTPDQAYALLPTHEAPPPALIYDTVQWLMAEDNDTDALTLLADYRGPVPQPELWWDLRARLARRGLTAGDAETAYQAIARHGLESGADFADAEWLAGWIALRFLGRPEVAAGHFHNLYEGVSYPISRARGAYWTGRANHDAGRAAEGDRWYRLASEHPTTFYGQLAALALAPGDRTLRLPPAPLPTSEQRRQVAGHPFTRAIRMLAAWDEPHLLTPWLTSLAAEDTSPGWKQAVADLARDLGRPELRVAVAKKAVNEQVTLIADGYPLVPVPPVTQPHAPSIEPALVLGIIRQESTFNTDAVSRAGARGLMQLMPDTARQVASTLRVGYAPQDLTGRPAYNIQLGTAYLSTLLKRSDGSYVYSIAGYNAGPGRVTTWRLDNGDPRGDLHRTVDWIEMIPFSETRNYVQRTLENVQVYRARLDGPGNALQIDRDLMR
jgi:soluble lytic murein transglycosylase